MKRAAPHVNSGARWQAMLNQGKAASIMSWILPGEEGIARGTRRVNGAEWLHVPGIPAVRRPTARGEFPTIGQLF